MGRREVVAVDESAIALEMGAECARKNGLVDRIRYVRGDARERITQAGREGGFDLVLCDPPKFAPTKSSKTGALRAYQKLAAAACRATRPGGLLLFVFVLGGHVGSSCSPARSLWARAKPTFARRCSSDSSKGFDHPVSAAFPEGLYLKSVLALIETI